MFVFIFLFSFLISAFVKLSNLKCCFLQLFLLCLDNIDVKALDLDCNNILSKKKKKQKQVYNEWDFRQNVRLCIFLLYRHVCVCVCVRNCEYKEERIEFKNKSEQMRFKQKVYIIWLSFLFLVFSTDFLEHTNFFKNKNFKLKLFKISKYIFFHLCLCVCVWWVLCLHVSMYMYVYIFS